MHNREKPVPHQLTSCPSEFRLDAYFTGELEGDEAYILELHIASCASCQARERERNEAMARVQTFKDYITVESEVRKATLERPAIEPVASRSMRVWWWMAGGLVLVASVLVWWLQRK
jgi:anti-sigma factor RsiW